jgi:UDP-glucose 6-dehydrogenase
MKVTVVGAGNVGATCADVIAHKELCNELILVDIKENLIVFKISYSSFINLRYFPTRTRRIGG